MTAPQKVRNLIAQYDRERARSQAEPQSVIRHQAKYLRKLFEALAWDRGGANADAAQGGRVVPEHTLKLIASEDRLPPEYSLRLDGNRKCFVGITPDVALAHDDPSPALHLRRFAWSANIPAAILGNFEELSVYSGRVRPRSDDRPDVARVLRFSYTEYEARWGDISDVLSKGAVEQGALERLAQGAVSVDDAFLGEIEGWRRRLAQDIDARNRALSLDDLNAAVQLVIDRIIFLRICEDRGIEPYGQLRALRQSSNTYRHLIEMFGRADARYNAGLFRSRAAVANSIDVTMGLSIGDEVLQSIFHGLYYPESPYEFSVIGADILGQVYERFLGQVIVRPAEGGVSVEEKPDVRKSGGVYYTPSHVVDHLVRGTVGRLCEGKTPEEVSRLRILDPACGSGSFLNVAYQYLLDWHRDWYVADGAERHRDRVRRIPRSGYHLMLDERKRILLNSIYGIDIDAQAVEVTKLSLLLKVLEGEEGNGVRRQQLVLVRDRVLPSLDENIQCGNSLVSPDFGARADGLTTDERERLRPFDYAASFPQVFASESPGFDVVLGNPPYLSYSGRQSVGLPDAVRGYYQDLFESYLRQTASYPIVGPHKHAVYFRNTLHALYAKEPWPDVRYIVGLLNSRFVRFLYQESVREARQGTFPQVKIGSLGALPLRAVDPAKPEEKAFHDEIVQNVEELLRLHPARAEASDVERAFIDKRIHLVDDRIDRLVDQLYDLSRENVVLIKQALGLEVPPPTLHRRDVEEMTSDELWSRLAGEAKDEIWRSALAELVEREDPGVAPYVVEELQGEADLPPAAREALVFAVERSQCFKPNVRAALKDVLLAQARIMRDADGGQPLWAAIRRFASLVPLVEVDALLDFLRDEDLSTTKQAALQAVQNIFSVELPVAIPAVTRLGARVHALAIELIVPECLSRPGGPSLALEAFCAAAALSDKDLADFADSLIALSLVDLIAQAREFLCSLQGGRPPEHEEGSHLALSDTIARLTSPLAAMTSGST